MKFRKFHFFFSALLLLEFASIGFQSFALTLDEISPHLSPDTQIIWEAPTNQLTKTLWTYKRKPQIFSPIAVSNALLLGEFKLKPFPKTFGNRVTVWDKQMEGDPRPDYFAVDPNWGMISFRRQRHPIEKGDTTPEALLIRTWHYAARLGLERGWLAQSTTTDKRTVFLLRKLDGIAFAPEGEGFSVQYGEHGEIRFLDLNWPKLERVTQERVITPAEIIQCIRVSKTPVFPLDDERDYFGRIKALSSIKTLTITNITPYYGEGKYGEQPNATGPEKFVEPMAVLDAIASWGKSNSVVKIAAPLIYSDAERLLK